MRALPTALIWLNRAFPFHVTLSAFFEQTMLSNAFQGCQSRNECVTVGVLSRGFPAGFAHARLVSSQSFPHLWKKLWKFAEVEYIEQIGADMNLWDQILARIETKMNRHTFYTWFRPTSFVAEDRSSITVRVPDSSFQE